MFSFLGLLGVVGMAGVVVNYLCKSGQSRDVSALVAKGTAGRLCAILLTTVTTAAGLLPLAYGIGGTDATMMPMALALGWGLLLATPLTFVLVPCLYMIGFDIRHFIFRIGRIHDRNSIFGGMKKGTDIVVNNLPDDFFGIFPLNHKLPGMDCGYFQPNLFQIVWFTESTEAEHLIDFEQHPVTADTFYCLGPGQVHFVSGGPLEGLRLLCPIEMFLDIVDDKSRWLFNQLNNDGIVVSNEVLQVLEPLSQIMVKEFQGANDPEIFKAYLKAFLCHIARSGPGYSISYGKDAARLHMLFSIVNKFYRSEKKVSFYANRVGLSPKRLNEILSHTTGSTLTAILHYNLITHAKREIGYGDKNFKQIAFELGFSEQAYFSRFFKRHTGLSPEAFRRKMFKLSKHSGQ